MLTVPLLGYHYCRHFLEDLQSIDLSSTVNNNQCSKCDRKFFDHRTLIADVGVKHKFINFVLEAKGFPTLDLFPRTKSAEFVKIPFLKNVSILSPSTKTMEVKPLLLNNLNVSVVSPTPVVEAPNTSHRNIVPMLPTISF